jgi:pimeloyl-ACP methyl ester carboxylesterase
VSANTVLLTTDEGSRLAVHDLGGAGPAILICHATGFCGRAYEPLAAVLAPEFQVWAIDFPGHGDSDPPPDGDFAWHRMVPHVLAAAEAISSEPLACVVGHSMGGAVALQAAADSPSLAAAAYLYEPILVPQTDETDEPAKPRPTGRNPMAEGARRRQPSFPSKEAALWRYAARPPLQELSAASLACYVDHGFATHPDGTVWLKCTPENEARTFEGSATITIGSVAKAALSTLLVTGGEPGSPLAAMAPPAVAALPRAELRVHPHLGHFGPLQGPGAIGAEIAVHARG